jgi:ATP-binding cassette subfamily B protein
VYAHLDIRRRRELAVTLGLMIVGAFAELVTVGAVLPFLTAVTGAGGDHYPLTTAFVRHAGEVSGLSTVGFSASLLILVAILSTVLRLLLVHASQNFVFAVAHDLAGEIYGRTLHQPYDFHVAHNSSRTIASIEKVQHLLGNVLLPAMQGSTAALVSLFIFAALMAVAPATTVFAGACFGLFYALVSLTSRRRLYRNADVIAETLQARVQTLQEGLGGIRDVLLDRSQAVFLAKFRRIDSRFRHAQASNHFIGATPRYIVEAGGVVLIAALTVYVAGRPGGVIAALPMLGALALGAQRLLPLVQQIYFSWSQIHGNRSAIEDVAALLDMPQQAHEPVRRLLNFETVLELDGISYTYPACTAPALRDISLTIQRGMRIGVVGKSGSGKSTLVDVIMGLLDPVGGRLKVDGRPLTPPLKQGWQAQIAHVPQALFLADCSIADNIAFGRDEVTIDMERVEDAARKADLHDFIRRLPDGYGTMVGERGIRLSGGQRQRIGIARALYKCAAILVLDEATSALDGETEASVMAALAGLSRDLTIISIAHRVSSLRQCDMIVHIEDGYIRAIGSYDAILSGWSDA